MRLLIAATALLFVACGSSVPPAPSQAASGPG